MPLTCGLSLGWECWCSWKENHFLSFLWLESELTWRSSVRRFSATAWQSSESCRLLAALVGWGLGKGLGDGTRAGLSRPAGIDAVASGTNCVSKHKQPAAIAECQSSAWWVKSFPCTISKSHPIKASIQTNPHKHTLEIESLRTNWRQEAWWFQPLKSTNTSTE